MGRYKKTSKPPEIVCGECRITIAPQQQRKNHNGRDLCLPCFQKKLLAEMISTTAQMVKELLEGVIKAYPTSWFRKWARKKEKEFARAKNLSELSDLLWRFKMNLLSKFVNHLKIQGVSCALWDGLEKFEQIIEKLPWKPKWLSEPEDD